MDNASLNFDITKTSKLTCTCGNHTFVHAVFLREISALVSPTGKAGVLPIPTFVCNACGRVPDQIVPAFLKAESGEPTQTVISSETSQNTTEPQSSAPTIRKGNLTLLKD